MPKKKKAASVRKQVREYLLAHPKTALTEMKDDVIKRFGSQSKSLRKNFHQYVSPIRRGLVADGKLAPLNANVRTVRSYIRSLAWADETLGQGSLVEAAKKRFSKMPEGFKVQEVARTILAEVEKSAAGGGKKTAKKVAKKAKKVAKKRK